MLLALSQPSRQMGQRLSSAMAMLSTCCGELGRGGNVELLLLTGAAAVSIMPGQAPQCSNQGKVSSMSIVPGYMAL